MIHEVGLLEWYDFKNLLLSSPYPLQIIEILHFKHASQ